MQQRRVTWNYPVCSWTVLELDMTMPALCIMLRTLLPNEGGMLSKWRKIFLDVLRMWDKEYPLVERTLNRPISYTSVQKSQFLLFVSCCHDVIHKLNPFNRLVIVMVEGLKISHAAIAYHKTWCIMGITFIILPLLRKFILSQSNYILYHTWG